MKLRTINDITTESLRGKRVFVRADFNVPMGENANIDREEAWRIEKGMRTIMYLHKAGAIVIVASHLGRKGESIRPVAEYINQEFGIDVGFVPDVTSDVVHDMVQELPHGGVLLLDNLRIHPGEKANDSSFAEELSTYSDIYINDAFSASHREHASIVGIPDHLPAYAGFQFIDEFNYLSKARNPGHPAMLILGGAKFGTKLALLNIYHDLIEEVFVGGALANNFFKKMGKAVGRSLVDDNADISKLVGSSKIFLPIDVTVQNTEGVVRIADPMLSDIAENETIVDCGPKTLEVLATKAAIMETIIWNGPLGNYEIGFDQNTRTLAKSLSDVHAETYLGGGDTVTVLQMENLTDSYTFVSTAGGAMLDFLVDGDLPGLSPLIL